MQSEMGNCLAGKLEAVQAQPIIEEFEDLPSLEVTVRNNSRPVRVAIRRRAQNSRERSKAGVKRGGAQAVGGITRGVKSGKGGVYKPKARREPDMSASMETLVSGEE